MSRDFDFFPTYDPLVKNDIYLSNLWSDFMATFVESLREYLSASGIFVPRLTLTQRDEIQDPQEGQMIYVTSDGAAELQIWKLVSNAGQWVTIV